MANKYQKVGIIIPARFQSSRLPGKPLIDILGKTMIQRTWEQCAKAFNQDHIYVATDDRRVADAVLGFGGKVVLTPESCPTGTDRVAEANASLGFDLVLNVQGDEPIIRPEDIQSYWTLHFKSR